MKNKMIKVKEKIKKVILIIGTLSLKIFLYLVLLLNKFVKFLTVRRKKENVARMRLTTIIYIGYRNLMVNRLRSFLTIAGVSVGIGIVTFLICIGFGIQKMIVNEVTRKNPIDVIDVNNKKLDNFVSLNKENVEKIKKIKGVKNIVVRVNTGGKIYYKDFQTDVVIYGTSLDYFKLSNSKVKSGNIDFQPNQHFNKVAVSSKIVNTLGFKKPEDIIGKHIKFDTILSRETNADLKEEKDITGNEAKVVAVIDDSSTAVWFPRCYLEDKFGINLAQEGKVKIDLEERNMNEIRKNIEILGFNTESVVDVVNDINSFFWVVRIVLIIFGTIIMSISAMGMLNTLSVSLLQRTKEVGILKALGAKRRDIFRMFIFEAAIISFIGGALGFLGGYSLARLSNGVFNFLAHQRNLDPVVFIYIPTYFVVALIIFIAFLGLVTGIGPARRAARIHALDALRYE